MEPLQQTINYFFFIIIYVPFNVVVMIATTLGFRFLNRAFQLNFPVWVVGLAAGLLIFIMMWAYIGTVDSRDGWVNFRGDNEYLLNATLIINGIVLVIMLCLILFTKLIIKSDASAPFEFAKPQIIATGIYVFITLFFALQPLFSNANKYMADIKDEHYLKNLQNIIETNDVAAFEKEMGENLRFWKVRFQDVAQPLNQIDLIDYLIAKNKMDLVNVSLQKNKDLLNYYHKWEIKSTEMIDVLIKNNMNPNRVINVLTNSNQRDFVKYTVDKFHPDFDSEVAIITMNVVAKNDAGMMDYLIASGFIKNLEQTSEAVKFYVEKNNFEAVKMLINRGFQIDAKDSRFVYLAVLNDNLPMLEYLFQYPFDINQRADEYTHLENAIIGGNEAIFDFLLTKKPDISMLHYTQLNGNINALIIAEKYKRTEMLKKLNFNL